RHLSADHMRAKQLPGFGIEDGLNKALGLAKCDGFSIGQKSKPADADLEAFLLGGLLGQPDARYLRQAIGAAGNGIATQWVDIVQASDLLDTDHAFAAGCVREPGRSDHIADGVDAGLMRLAPVINDDAAFLDFDLGAFEP